MEFLIGRTLTNNIINLHVEKYVREDLRSDPQSTLVATNNALMF